MQRLLTLCATLSCLTATFSGHLRADDARSWKTQQLDSTFYSEGASAGDIDGDSHVDIVSGPFVFLGPTFETKLEMYPPAPFDPHGYSDNFFSFVDDIDGDDRNDVLVIGFPGKEAYWYENPGDVRTSGHWPRHLALDVVDNESPTYTDLVGDARPEIVCSRGGFFGYASAGENPAQPWTWHSISDQSAGGRFTHGLGVGDVNGDGRRDVLEKTGWWEQPESLDGDPQWRKHDVPFSAPGGSQMFAFDVDGDGDNDVVTALEAHGYGVAWYEHQQQGERVRFERHMIVGRQPQDSPFGVVFSQPHAIDIGDIDGDGLLDIVTGKRYWAHGPHGDPEPNGTPVLYWFRCVRNPQGDGAPKVAFQPHLISELSGVGTDVVIADVNSDSHPDVVVGNKRGTFIHTQQPVDTQQPAADAAGTRADPADLTDTTASWNAAEIGPADQLPTEGLLPEEAVAAMTVPDGFAVDLVAGEPLVHQPVAFTFDAQGRIWLAEAHTYPIRAPEGQGEDRIIVLEDTDKDGAYEKRTTFAENLNLISGLEVGFGGVWVGAAPYLMFLPDADGDLQPDSAPEIVLDGWGYQDTHETLNAFRWGPDGWLYGCQGVFTHSNIGAPGTPDDQRTPLNAGVWRFHPVRRQFEVFAHGTSNPWGVDFDSQGQAVITACVIPHAYHIVQGGRYQRQAGQHFNPYTFDDIKTIADHAHYAGSIQDHAWWGRDEPVHDDATSAAGGGHAHCGALIYQGDNWPADYRGSLLMANIHGNRINTDLLRRDGSSLIAAHGHDLMFANDPWFRGITIRTGPDGAVYISDWYDANACHRRSPEIWDRTNGRVYRIRYGAVTLPTVDLEQLTSAELVALHDHPNQWFVRTARRVLQQRHAGATSEVPPAVTASLQDRVFDDSANSERRLDALWTLHCMQPVADELALQLLESRDENLRAWAIQLALEDHQASPQLVDRLVQLAEQESSPRVRLYLASALQRLPRQACWPLATALAHHSDSQFDKNIPLVLWYGIEPLVAADVERALELARSTQIPLIRTFIYRRAAGDPQLMPQLISELATTGDKTVVQTVFRELASAADRLGSVRMPSAWPAVVERYSSDADESVRQTVMTLSVQFGDESIFPTLREIASGGTAPAPLRRTALESLARGKDPQLASLALELIDDPELQTTAIRLLARTASGDVAPRLIAGLKTWPTETRAAAIDTLTSRPALAAKLINAIESGELPRSVLHATDVNKILALNDPELNDRLSSVWGSVRRSPEELQTLIAEYRRKLRPKRIERADASAGRKVYVDNCGKCHKLFGEGGDLGPELTGANRGSTEYWLENVIDPNAVVGKDYLTRSILTIDGVVLTGMVREETETAIVIEDADKRTTIPKSEIEQMSSTGKSLMPEGQLTAMTIDQAADLFAYLKSPRQVALPGQIPDPDPQTGRVPGAIEGETLEVLERTGGRTQTQGMGNFGGDHWSGDSHLWWTGGKPGDQLTLAFEVPADGEYDLIAMLTKAHDYGVVRMQVDDQEPTAPIDLYHRPAVIRSGPISLGNYDLAAGRHQLRVTLQAPNPDATPRNMFGIDFLALVPKDGE